MPTSSIPLALVLLLCALVPSTASAAELPPLGPATFALEEEPEAEAAAEEVEIEEACEEAEEEFEGFEECEEVESGAAQAASAREECVLRTARAHAALSRTGEKLKLTIGYTAYEPAKAKIEVGRVGTVKRHLGRSGVVRITKKLGANSGKRLVVTIEIPSARNAGCPSRRLVITPR
jgi:hypothetical protein